ncbi:MAG: glycosyltransferase [Pseudohongiellaceae bacterium]|nr:glycosyltransferase [Pseudohongiellaceae bacterium]
MNRPELVEALKSIEAQRYGSLEIVLVDASGEGLSVHRDLQLSSPLNEVTGKGQLNRPAAANVALNHAKGEYCLFLDEDDWIAPDHIGNLVAVLQNNPELGVAYSSTQKAAIDGSLLEGTFRQDFDAAVLRRDNFIPIHSALFRRELVECGCRFDESLDIFEDWDFWLQISQHAGFFHLDEMTAFYRDGGESNTATKDSGSRFKAGNPISAGRALLFKKWFKVWSGQQINESFGSLDKEAEIDTLQQTAKSLNDELVAVYEQNKKLNTELEELTQDNEAQKAQLLKTQQRLQRKIAELESSKAHIVQLNEHIQLIYSSLSWRITRPVRGLKQLLIKAGARKFKEKLNARKLGKERREGVAASGVKISLDSPSPERLAFSEQITVQGWCLASSGISNIELFIDGDVKATFSTGITRPDIADEFPHVADAITSGFYQEVSLEDIPVGEHELIIRACDNDGSCEELNRNIIVQEKADLYNAWYWQNTPEAAEVVKQIPHISLVKKTRKFHIIFLSEGGDSTLLAASLNSIEEQSWNDLELHIVGETAKRFSALKTHASAQEAIECIEEEQSWLLFMRGGELLAPNALLEFSKAIEEGDELVYCDHDQYTSDDRHLNPVFTPQWSPEHLYANNYIGNVYAVRRDVLKSDDMPQADSGNWRYSVLLRLSEHIDEPRRIAKVLWSEPVCDDVAKARASEYQSVSAWLQESHPNAELEESEYGLRHIKWPLQSEPKVSIIIPTMGNLKLIKPCIESLQAKTQYSNYEIVILDNGRGKYPEGIAYLQDKQLKIIECNYPFNWAKLNNEGARHASGQVYLFLNDDVEIIEGDWLEEMLRLAIKPSTATVGARLFYPNGAMQHAGVMLVAHGGGALHQFHKRMPSKRIYRALHATTREVSASTGACLMVTKQKFEEVEGFDEELAVVGNDVDLCMRLSLKSYRNIWTPNASLIHHESISRKSSVPKEDEEAMWSRWGEYFSSGDKYYNPNLSSIEGDYSLDVGVESNSTAQSIDVPLKRLASGGDRAGVNLIGYTRAEMGIGEGARSDAKALTAAKEPFGIICFQGGNPSRMGDLSWQHKETTSADYDITLVHINPDQVGRVISELPSAYFDNHYVIGYWAWELPVIPKDWESAFGHFDEIWVPSSFVQDAVAIKSPVPVIRVPHAIEVADTAKLPRQHFALPENAFIFLSMFDTHSLAERKNPYGAISAFQKAFDSNDMNVRLVLKVNNCTAEAMDALKLAIGKYKNIIIVNKVFSREEINSLIGCIDCFVSLHRSEGFGLGPAEAMALGKVVLATNWSGNVDYMSPDNSVCVSYTLIEVDKDYGPYKKGQIWADPDINQAAEGMRSLVDDKALAERLAKRALHTIASEFSPRVVGELMRARLAQIRSNRSG